MNRIDVAFKNRIADTETMQHMNVGLLNAFAVHGEGLVLSRCSPYPKEHPVIWPELAASPGDGEEPWTITATVDGAVVGRAWLPMEQYPFARFMGLEVLPAFRGKGLGSRIVDFAIRHAASRGYLAMHLAVEYRNIFAHRLYARRGFVPADRSQYLFRMVRFLNYPALSHFLLAHPLAEFSSRACEGIQELKWADILSNDHLVISFAGESRFGDGEGFGPGIHTLDIKSGALQLHCQLTCPDYAAKGSVFEADVHITNTGEDKVEGACRLLLNAGFAPDTGSPGVAAFAVEPKREHHITLPVQVMGSLNAEALDLGTYKSVPVCIEFFVGEHVFWLAKQIKIDEDGKHEHE